MSTPSIDRVREDLATVRQAAGFETYFGREDVAGNLAIAAWGLAFAGWAAAGPGSQLRPVAVLFAVGLLAFWAYMAIRARSRRAVRPATWREHRLNLLAAIVLMPAVVAFTKWEQWLGVPREAVGAAAVVFTGLGVLLVGILSRGRLYYIGGAIPLVAFGLAIPYCTPRQVLVAAGLCLATAGLAMAGVQTWQLRNETAADAH